MQADIIAQKRALRAAQKERRAAIDNEERARANAAICRTLAANSAFLEADLLLAFYPMEQEVDLRALYALALQQGKVIAFPRCVGTQMRFHRVTSLDALTKGRFGIMTPPEEAPVVTPTAHTLCLLPALAATKDGARLGYGGGFYDRFLKQHPCRTLLPIYHCLLLPQLPTEQTDIKAQTVITEKGALH